MNLLRKDTKAAVLLSICAAFILLATACTKEPGPGGLAKIQGKVFTRDLDKDGYVKDTGYLAEARVYIAADGDISSFKDVRTNGDGAFEFRFLQKGKYRVWVISRCDTCQLQTATITQNVEITGKKEVLVLPDFRIDS